MCRWRYDVIFARGSLNSISTYMCVAYLFQWIFYCNVTHSSKDHVSVTKVINQFWVDVIALVQIIKLTYQPNLSIFYLNVRFSTDCYISNLKKKSYIAFYSIK